MVTNEISHMKKVMTSVLIDEILEDSLLFIHSLVIMAHGIVGSTSSILIF